MKVSAKTEYACIAMLQLAHSFGSGEPVRIRKIAEDHGVPSRFLVQILLQLKGAGYVNSTRGAAGGYELIKPPAEISLLEVMNVIEGPEALAPPNATADSPAGKVLHSCWQDVAQVEARDAGIDHVRRTDREHAQATREHVLHLAAAALRRLAMRTFSAGAERPRVTRC